MQSSLKKLPTILDLQGYIGITHALILSLQVLVTQPVQAMIRSGAVSPLAAQAAGTHEGTLKLTPTRTVTGIRSGKRHLLP